MSKWKNFVHFLIVKMCVGRRTLAGASSEQLKILYPDLALGGATQRSGLVLVTRDQLYPVHIGKSLGNRLGDWN